MLDIKFIRENADIVKEAVKNKGANVDIGKLLEMDKKRREIVSIVEGLRAKQNKASENIASENDSGKKRALIQEMRSVKSEFQKNEAELKEAEADFKKLLMQVPNIPFKEAPVGLDEKANVILKEEGQRTSFLFEPRNYLSIAGKKDWIDIERASKVSGTRFGYIKGDLALMEFAIVRYALDFLTKNGFIPVLPPVLVKPEYMEAMGFLYGEAADDVYYLEKDGLYLVGTSEQAIGPMHAGEILKEENLPLRYAGFSTCFRREAGSYGKDTKGILRVHQFDKVEMVVFAHPEKSREEHKYLLSLNETMMQELRLPYRIVHISTGDMGLSKAEQFDIETWIPSENTYRETHSASNTTDFQARRLGVKYGKDKEYVHILNDTAFAIGRTLIAIIENYQTQDGNVRVPKALQPYMGKEEI